MSQARLLTCPLCGARFPESPSCPSGCPLAARCATVCCPHCHYRFVLSTGLSRLLEKFLGRKGS
jgi:hypothetical protein